MPEAPEGQIFLGWKIKGNESGPSYAVGDALDFTSEDIFRYVGNGDGERDGYLTLVAMYTDEIAYGSSRPVNVKYFFENEDGEFVEDQEMRTTVQGVAGKQLSMLQHDNTLEHDGYEYTFDADTSKTTIEVTGDNAIELRYKLERVDYTYTAGGGGSVNPTSEIVIAQKEGAAKGSVATANEGYKFDGWYVNDGGKDVKITEDNAGGYNVKLTDNGTKLIPQRHNGKYEGGTFTAKFEQKQGKVRYNLTLDGATWVGGVPSSMESQPDENGFYVEKDRYSRNDTFKVTSAVPQCEGYVFVGWFDKDRTNTTGGEGATIRTAGSDVTYIYEGDSQPYTLDALWVSIDAQGGADTYNGKDHFITAESAFEAGNLKDAEDSDYLGEIVQAGLVSFGDMEYRYQKDGGAWSEWSTTNPALVDAGTYTVEVRQNVTVGSTTTPLTAEATYIINKRDVTLTSGTSSREYNGEPLTNGEVTVGGDGFVGEEGATYDVTGTRTVVGTSDNTFTYELKPNTKAGNYNITTKLGTLTVTPTNMEIVAEITGGTFEYDGQPHGATVEIKGLPAGLTGTGVSSERVTNVADGEVTASIDSVKIVDSTGRDVTPYFTNIDMDATATIEVTPAPLKVVTKSASRPYNGDPLTAGGDITGWKNGEEASLVTLGSQTEVGKSDNTYEINWDGATAAESNYEVTSETIGMLEVTPAGTTEFGISARPYVNVYDGLTHDAVIDPQVIGNYVDGTEWTFTYSLSADGEYTEDVPKVTDATEGVNIWVKAYNANYGETAATMVIAIVTPAELTVTTGSDSKAYDGTPLTAGGSLDGQVNNESITLLVTGSQTAVGSSTNTYQLVWGSTDSGNYTIVEHLGTLTVTPAPVTPDPTPDNPPTPPIPGGGGDTPTPGPDTPGTTPGGTTPGTGDDDATDEGEEEATEETIDDDATPMASGLNESSIADDATPLASGTDADQHENCWVHWLMIVGIVLSVIYFAGVGIRRSRYTSDLHSYENQVLGVDDEQNPNQNAAA